MTAEKTDGKIKDCKFRVRQKETVRYEGTGCWWMCIKDVSQSTSPNCSFHGSKNLKECRDAVMINDR